MAQLIPRRLLVALPLLAAALAWTGSLSAQEPLALPAPVTSAGSPPWFDDVEPIAYPQSEAQLELLREQLLDLEPDRKNRQFLEQVRATESRPVEIDTTDQEWIELNGTKLRWGGRIQGDLVGWTDDREFGGQSNYFEFRRVRLFAAGHGYGIFDYMLEVEFANDSLTDAPSFDDRFTLGSSGVELKDAYLNAVDVPYLGQFRIGHFMAPVGLEQLTSSKNITFLERALPLRMVPGRELGLAAFNHNAAQTMTWAAGAFLHDLSDSAYVLEDDSQGFRLAGRLTHTPYYDEVSGGRFVFHTGLGYAYTQPRRRDDPDFPGVPFYPVEFDARPEIHRGEELISTENLNTRRMHVLDAEMALVVGSFSLQGEAVWTRLKQFPSGTTDLYGTYLFASYFLTGEHRNYDRQKASFGPITPYENFWIVDTTCGPQAGWGAWELAARWSYLDFSEIAGQQLNDLTVGCNWYWNPHTRMMFNWIHPFAHNSPIGIAPNAQGDILAMRLEVNF